MSYAIGNIDPARTVVIVVDMQNDFVADGAVYKSKAANEMVSELAKMLEFSRARGLRVLYTAHVHRRDGSDMGLFAELHPPIAQRSALIEGTDGVEIYPALAPAPGEHVVKKHRYSGFFGTDLDLILREWRIETVVITGTTTENCCHATARDAMFRNYRVAVISDLTATFDYPDSGYGEMTADEVHRATLTILGFSTAHVMTASEFRALLPIAD